MTDALVMAIWRRGEPTRCCITPIVAARANSSGRRNTLMKEVAMKIVRINLPVKRTVIVGLPYFPNVLISRVPTSGVRI